MEYFLLKPTGEQTGTYSKQQIKDMLVTGAIDGSTYYWCEGMPDWKPTSMIDDVAEFEPLQEGSLELPAHPPRPLPGIQRSGRAFTKKVSRPYDPSVALKQAERPPVPPPPTIPAARLDVPVVPVAPVVTQDAPAPEPEPVEVPPAEASAVPTSPVIETVQREPFPEEKPRKKPVSRFALYIMVLTLMTLAMVLVLVARNATPAGPIAQVTLTDVHPFVLLNQSAIRAYNEEMRDTSSIDSLAVQLHGTTNPILMQSLMVEIEKEKVRHVETVRDKYLRSRDAGYIDPGTYDVLGYVDDFGTLVTPRANCAWAAITYKDQVVFAPITKTLPAAAAAP